MRFLVLLCLVVSFAAHASPLWQSTGSTILGPDSPTSLIADGDGFVVGRPTSDSLGMVSLVLPGQALPVLTLPATETGPGAEFGHRVAISGDLMAITEARRNMNPAANSGQVKFYEHIGGVWTKSHMVGPPAQPSMDQQFGTSLATIPNRVFIGASGSFFARGTVYVYDRNPGGTWPMDPDGAVFAYDGASGDGFGSSIAAEGEWLAVSATNKTVISLHAGAVYIFRKIDDIYVQTQRLMMPVLQDRAFFGNAISMHDGRLIIGAFSEDDPVAGVESGAAYVYALQHGVWQLEQRLMASDAAPFRFFGSVVAIRGETICVSGYVFERQGSTWIETGRLNPGFTKIEISQQAISMTVFVSPNYVVRHYPTTERIFQTGFDD